MLRALAILVPLALAVYCLVDCAQSDAERVRHLEKPFWLVLIIVFPLIGGLAWLIAGRPPARPRGAGRGVAPKGPDDDPDFLSGLRTDPPATPTERDQSLQEWEDELRCRDERLRGEGDGKEPGDGPGPRS